MKKRQNKNVVRLVIASVLLSTVFLVPSIAQEATNKTEEAENSKKGITSLAPSGQMIEPNWQNEPLKNVIQDLSDLSGTNIQISDDVDPKSKINYVSPVPLYWRDVLNRILEKNDFLARRIGPHQIEVIKPQPVSMDVRDSKFTSIVNTLSKLKGLSIIVSPAVAAQDVTIPSLSLNDVPWQEALETVVKTAGFATVKEDYGIRRVITLQELRNQLETKTFQLRYLRPPSNYKGTIQSTYLDDEEGGGGGGDTGGTEGPFDWSLLNVISGFLTKQGGEPIGSMQYEEERNILVVKDTPQVLRKVQGMLNVLDNEPPQILVQIRFISTENDFLRDLGLQLNTSGSSLTGAGIGTGIAESSAVDDNEETSYPFSFGADTDMSSIGPYLTEYTLDWTLRMFQRDTSSRVVQAPRLVVMDGQKATVFVGQEIHFGTVKTESATAGSATVTQSIEEAEFSPVENGFQLFVVPHVVRGSDRIMLTVVPKNNNVTFPAANTITLSGTGTNTSVRFPTINTSTVVTRMILKSGTTAVLAGLINENDQAQKQGLPWLGDIPVFGYLFSAEGQDRSKSYDFFFITAYILPSVSEERQRISQRLQERAKKAGQSYDSKSRNHQRKSLDERLEERRKENLKEFQNIQKSGEKD